MLPYQGLRDLLSPRKKKIGDAISRATFKGMNAALAAAPRIWDQPFRTAKGRAQSSKTRGAKPARRAPSATSFASKLTLFHRRTRSIVIRLDQLTQQTHELVVFSFAER